MFSALVRYNRILCPILRIRSSKNISYMLLRCLAASNDCCRLLISWSWMLGWIIFLSELGQKQHCSSSEGKRIRRRDPSYGDHLLFFERCQHSNAAAHEWRLRWRFAAGCDIDVVRYMMNIHESIFLILKCFLDQGHTKSLFVGDWSKKVSSLSFHHIAQHKILISWSWLGRHQSWKFLWYKQYYSTKNFPQT